MVSSHFNLYEDQVPVKEIIRDTRCIGKDTATSVTLTHLPLDRMAAILQTIFPGALLCMKHFCISIKISLKFVPKGPIDNNPALI